MQFPKAPPSMSPHRYRRHSVVLAARLVPLAMLLGVGMGVIAVLSPWIDQDLGRLRLFVSLGLIGGVAGFALYHGAAWHVFAIEPQPGTIKVRVLQGAMVQRTTYDLHARTYRRQRHLLDAFFDTGTLVVETSTGLVRYRWIANFTTFCDALDNHPPPTPPSVHSTRLNPPTRRYAPLPAQRSIGQPQPSTNTPPRRQRRAHHRLSR